MPYCPKCDMEFVEGITQCSDCKGPLVESKEAAMALKKATQQQTEAAVRHQMETAMMNAAKIEEKDVLRAKRSVPVKAYVKKEQRYEDMNSSATAFFFVGGLTAVFVVLTLTGIVPLSMHPVTRLIFQGMLAAMSIASFAVAISSRKRAGVLKTEAVDEEKETEEIVQWFIKTYSGKDLDQQILSEEPDLSEEEMSLRRFDLIQDYLITGRDLPDMSYVDELCDLIYSRFYENER